MSEHITPVMYIDISGESGTLILGLVLGLTVAEVIIIAVIVVLFTVMILEIANDFYYTNKLIDYINQSSSLPLKGDVNTPGRLYDNEGNLKQKRWYGEDGLPIRDRDYTDHENPKKHPLVPHDHDWDFDYANDKSPRSKEREEPDYENYPDD
jgi:hypothetical protein